LIPIWVKYASNSSHGWGHWNLLLQMHWYRDAISSFDVLIYVTPYWIKKFITSYRLIRNIKSKMILKMYVLFGPAPNVNLQYEPYCCIPQYWIEFLVDTIIESVQECPGKCKKFPLYKRNFNSQNKKWLPYFINRADQTMTIGSPISVQG
jgi:hypothetical protein